MREGPIYAAAMLAGALAVFTWTILRERRDRVMADHIQAALSDMPPLEHTVTPFVVVNRVHNGHVLFCERCRLYLLEGVPLDHDEAVRRAVWHAEAHHMEAV